ncbi:twin-arginine translocation signal domain-containing protein [Conexibacter sp. W3-3-2]|nr:twin-arginine translocation signal domain-containing protein [Conexibacter sp. W3-3-2]
MTSSSDDPASQETTPIGRRAFLGTLAVGGVTLATGNALTDALARLASPITGRLPQGATCPRVIVGMADLHRLAPHAAVRTVALAARYRRRRDTTNPLQLRRAPSPFLARRRPPTSTASPDGASRTCAGKGVSVAAILDRAGLLAGAPDKVGSFPPSAPTWTH